MQQNNPYNDFGSSLSDIILSGGNGKNTLESIFNNCSSSSVKSNSVRRRRPLGSSVYLKQRDLLHKFSEQNKGKIKMSNSLFKSEFIDPFKKKLYRGVRQRNSGRWVAEIKLPQNRMRVWLGSYETAESAAFAYDRAANKLGGEYAKLNFPNVQDSSQLGLIGDTQKLKALKISVDSKIQAICQKMKREKAMKKKNKKVDSENESEKVMNTEWQCCSSVSNGGKEVTSSASMCEDGFWKVAGESEFEGCTLDSLPSYDPELIWEILAN